MGRVRAVRTRIRRVPQPRKKATKRVDVTRGEFNDVIDLLRVRGEVIQDIQRALNVQFQRIADLQAELDAVKRAFERTKPNG